MLLSWRPETPEQSVRWLLLSLAEGSLPLRSLDRIRLDLRPIPKGSHTPGCAGRHHERSRWDRLTFILKRGSLPAVHVRLTSCGRLPSVVAVHPPLDAAERSGANLRGASGSFCIERVGQHSL